MSSKRLDTIADYSRHGYVLRVDCHGCKRMVLMNPLELTYLCQKRQWSRQMAAIERRLVCSQCGSRDIRLGPAFGK